MHITVRRQKPLGTSICSRSLSKVDAGTGAHADICGHLSISISVRTNVDSEGLSDRKDGE
ncbi:hypothetical protein ABOM_000419 [Aspergillus bombycis]|uniref:Uncharacterized protein n=1 Tax=Aspergillus bombycis TaxID=109264 RepID=A0A1F8AIF7_9EURO|nr:hypothetical protein ABOM_000419 [Aspergillus bombycis]OGM51088.1 hypothetical protein ABOM_000419 [Aspergillus bombycis]